MPRMGAAPAAFSAADQPLMGTIQQGASSTTGSSAASIARLWRTVDGPTQSNPIQRVLRYSAQSSVL